MHRQKRPENLDVSVEVQGRGAAKPVSGGTKDKAPGRVRP